MSFVRCAALASGGLFFSAATAFAGPAYLFSVSDGGQPFQRWDDNALAEGVNSVKVLVDLADTSLPQCQRSGFINTGAHGPGVGPHTPFAFTLAGTEIGVTATFCPAYRRELFLWDTGPADATFSLSMMNGHGYSVWDLGIPINNTAGNGTSSAYYGDLEFIVTRASGLSIDDFIRTRVARCRQFRSGIFAADLTDGGSNTGEQAWLTRITCATDCGPETRGGANPVPEPASLAFSAQPSWARPAQSATPERCAKRWR